MLNKFLILFISYLLTLSVAQAEIYSWKDASGNTIYSDQKISKDAKPIAQSSNNNYYQNNTSNDSKETTNSDRVETLSVLTAEGESQQDSEPEFTEKNCRENYNRSCDEVVNWQANAKQQCGSDSRCEDPDFLERKYRPRSNDELRKIALNAAIRNNNQEQKIALFLTKKYTNYCENQAELLCRNKISRDCQATMEAYCDDPRDLEDIFNQYDNLNALEKRAIIAKAKQLAKSSGDQQLDYENIIASLIEILVSQAMLGL